MKERDEQAESNCVHTNSATLETFIHDLLDVLHLQAKEIERLTAHVEQQTKRLTPAGQMSTVVSELSELRNRLRARHECHEHPCEHAQVAPELRGQRIPTKDMDTLC